MYRSWSAKIGQIPMVSKTFCPVSAAERSKRFSPIERKNFAKSKASEEGEGTKTTPRSALDLRHDWQLHQMVGFMCSVDGVRKTLVRRLPCMNPLAGEGEPQFATEGSRTPFFGFWAHDAWYNAFVPVLQKVFGNIVNVRDEEELDMLLGATVKL
jgi:hypothetical protein